MAGNRKRSALAGDCDVFATAAGAAISAARFRDRACDFIGVDPAKRGGLCEFAGLAIGPRGGGSTFVAACEAFIDAVAVGLICDDEHTAVGQSG